MLVIAHRTCPTHAPENSVEGIATAARFGADLVEVDVRRGGGDRLVLAHDATLLRLARTRGRRATTLDAALEAAVSAGIGIAFDIKDDGAADPLLTRLQGVDLPPSFLWTRSTDVAQALRAAHPPQEIALLRDTDGRDAALELLDDAAASGAAAVSAAWDAVDEWFRAEAERRALRVYAWCQVRGASQAKHHLLDGLVTDWPEDVR